MMMRYANQQPLMCHFSWEATQQMQGQHSCSILTKYLRQSRSAGTSAPFSWAAFSQTGQALLMSSMHRTSRSWGQSAGAAEAKTASRARMSTKSFIWMIKKLLLLIGNEGNQQRFRRYEKWREASRGLDRRSIWKGIMGSNGGVFVCIKQVICGRSIFRSDKWLFMM